ncbi:hypothetical protein GDO81_018330 [Engystomops pustulosus]|uniref:Uncharacterized protein n=1 Tax=Engystomops pustulosus TaxID=76066 RepID=A0AAV7A643_ENGPU|nr:hypothetical protein GDO81_018330 [Engystomops pustulosus]
MDVQVAPLRPWDDFCPHKNFFPGSDRFGRPDFKDISKWNNGLSVTYCTTNQLSGPGRSRHLSGGVSIHDASS